MIINVRELQPPLSVAFSVCCFLPSVGGSELSAATPSASQAVMCER